MVGTGAVPVSDEGNRDVKHTENCGSDHGHMVGGPGKDSGMIQTGEKMLLAPVAVAID